MSSQLEKGFNCVKIVQVYEQNSIVNSVCVNNCIDKLVIIASYVREIEIFIHISYTADI